MSQSVEGFCNLLARNRLLEPEVIRDLRQRWRTEAREGADDPARFSRWVITSGYLTDFQYGLLVRGFADMLFLGEYKLLDRIGQGRMAGVYKATHRLGQVVAIKVLPPSRAGKPELLARFQREARLAMRLKHPSIVRTFQTGRTRGDLHYLVMEYLDGETLEDVLERRGRLPIGEAVPILLQALRGLQHIDEEGMVHRDLKPGNLMLVPASGKTAEDTTAGATVKILDIGLGRALFDEGMPGALEAADLTDEGSLLGTPNYMAPEQARNAHAADIRSDLYSLGCVFYHLLTGQPPFSDTSLVRQMLRHLQEPPRPLRQLNADIPPQFQPVMDRFLDKDPAQRYPTALQAARAVQALLPHGHVAPPPPEPGPQMRSFLTWLETNHDEDEAAAQPTYAPAPAPPTAVKAKAAVVPAPAGRPLGPTPAVVPVGQPFAPPPTARPGGAGAPVTIPVSVVGAEPAPWRALLRPGARDLLFAAAGAGALLLLEALLWLILALVY